jgi:hypothetical protein
MEPDEKLATAIDRHLKGLPVREAPASLAENVMAIVRQYEARPWWQRTWFEWPIALRWVSGLAMVLILGAMGVVDLSAVTGLFERAVVVLQQASTIAEPVMEMFQSIAVAIPIYVWCLIAMAAAMSWMTTLGLGVVCYQLVRTRKQVSH